MLGWSRISKQDEVFTVLELSQSTSLERIVEPPLEDDIRFQRAPTEGKITKRVLLCGLCAILGIGIVCIVFPIIAFRHGRDKSLASRMPSSKTLYIVELAAAALVTQCNECLGLIHTVTLRSALLREGRLHFNTNLRLLTYARASVANGWFANVLWMFALALTYASTGQLFNTVSMWKTWVFKLEVNMIALLVLGASLVLQSAIAAWAYVSTRRNIYSWSSNAVNTSLVCYNSGFQYNPQRCMVPYEQQYVARDGDLPQPSEPKFRQQSLFEVRKAAKLTLYLLWAAFVATIVWAIIVQIFVLKVQLYSEDAIMDYDYAWTFPHIGKILCIKDFGPKQKHDADLTTWHDSFQQLIFMAVVLAMQLYLTFSLHCAEIIVNAIRDEKQWRKASALKAKGALINQNAILSAFSSWETMMLSTFKALIHWGFSQAVVVDFTDSFFMDYEGGAILIFPTAIFLLSVFVLCLAGFATFLVCRQPKGPQPAAYGHCQTLVNLIDDWGTTGEPLFWGDKGAKFDETLGQEVRHAGTAADKAALGPIQMEAYYR